MLKEGAGFANGFCLLVRSRKKATKKATQQWLAKGGLRRPNDPGGLTGVCNVLPLSRHMLLQAHLRKISFRVLVGNVLR